MWAILYHLHALFVFSVFQPYISQQAVENIAWVPLAAVLIFMAGLCITLIATNWRIAWIFHFFAREQLYPWNIFLTIRKMNLPGFSIGLGPIPWVINAEVFPKEAKVVTSVKINGIVRSLYNKKPKHYMIPTIRTLAPHFALLSTGSAPSSLLDSIQAQLRWVLHLHQAIIIIIITIYPLDQALSKRSWCLFKITTKASLKSIAL